MLSQSIITYSAPSAPLASTSRFRRVAVYTRCLRCAMASATREWFRAFAARSVSTCHPPPTPGSSPAAYAQLLDRRRWPSHDPNCSALPTPPLIRFTWASNFGATSVRSRCGLSTCLPPLADPTGIRSQPTETFTPGLPTSWSPFSSPSMTTMAAGQLPSAGLSPARTAASIAARGSGAGAVIRRQLLGRIRGFPLRARVEAAVIPFPAPAASHAACGFTALRAPAPLRDKGYEAAQDRRRLQHDGPYATR